MNSPIVQSPVFGLSRECLVSARWFAREQINLFERHWLCAGRIPRGGTAEGGAAYILVSVGDYSIIVTATPAGDVRAWHNVCRHRGTRLLDQPCGTLRNGCISCPYHAWTYDADGILIGAPNMGSQNGFERDHFGLLPVRAATWGGYVFINLDDQAEPFGEFIAPLADRLANWNLHALRLVTTVTYRVQANWKLLFQNYSECYHCPTVHPDLNRVTPYRNATNDLVEGPILGGPMGLADGFASVTRDGRAVATPFPQLDAVQQRSVYYYTVFPTCFVSAHPDYVMVHRLAPRSEDQTDVACEFLVVPDTSDKAVQAAVDMWDEINRQDWHVCELTQAGVSSPAFRPGPYSPLEPMLVAFDRHYRQAMGCG